MNIVEADEYTALNAELQKTWCCAVLSHRESVTLESHMQACDSLFLRSLKWPHSPGPRQSPQDFAPLGLGCLLSSVPTPTNTADFLCSK